MEESVLLRCVYFKRDGVLYEARFLGRRMMWCEKAQVVFIDWPRTMWKVDGFDAKPCTALAREGPKAMALYCGGGA